MARTRLMAWWHFVTPTMPWRDLIVGQVLMLRPPSKR